MRDEYREKNKIKYGKKFFVFYNKKCCNLQCSKVNFQHGSDEFFINTSDFINESFEHYLEFESCYDLRLPNFLAQFLIDNTQSTSDEMKAKTVDVFKSMLMQILQHFKRTYDSKCMDNGDKAGPDYPRLSPGPSDCATLQPR